MPNVRNAVRGRERRPGLVDNKAVSGFRPTLVSGCVLWLRSDMGLYQDTTKTTPVSADGQAVAAWVDQSASAVDMLQSTSGNRPLWKVNIVKGKPALYFDGSNDNLIGASGLGLDGEDKPLSVFVALQLSSTAAARTTGTLCRNGSTPPMHSFMENGASGSGLRILRRSDANAQVEASSGGVDTYWSIWSQVFAGTTVSVWRNGAALISGASLNTGTASYNEVAVGSFRGTTSPANYWLGYIAEVIIYNAALSAGNRLLVEKYLNNRYLYP